MSKATRQQVYEALDGERAYQNDRWGGPIHDDRKRPEEWLVYMKVYLDKAFEAITTDKDDIAIPNTLDVIRKVTALGVGAMEALGAPHRSGY